MYAKDKITIVDRREFLRIKVASLVAETKIIRKAERKTNGVLRDEMRNHRALVVRRESRHAGLALGLIRGRTLEQMEPNRRKDNEPDHKKIEAMLKRYGRWGWIYVDGVYSEKTVVLASLSALPSVTPTEVRTMPVKASVYFWNKVATTMAG